jgi:hypothetical protein
MGSWWDRRARPGCFNHEWTRIYTNFKPLSDRDHSDKKKQTPDEGTAERMGGRLVDDYPIVRPGLTTAIGVEWWIFHRSNGCFAEQHG